MDKRTAIGFGFIILVIILLPYYYKAVLPPTEPVVQPEISGEETTTPDTTSTYIAPKELTTQEEFPREISEPGALGTGGFSPELQPETIRVETPLYSMAFSTRGGVLTECKLLEYNDQYGDPVQIIREDSQSNLNLILYNLGNALDLRQIKFVPDKKDLFISETGEGKLTLRAQTEDGSWVQKKFTFRGDVYTIQMQIDAGGIADLDPFYELYWGDGMAITEADSTQDVYYAKAYAYMGGELETFSEKGKKDLAGQASGQTDWVAQRNKYFEVALLPVSQKAKGVLFGIQAKAKVGKIIPKVYSMALSMGGRLDREPAVFDVFCGPLDQNIIRNVHPALEETMNWGWAVIEPFSKLVLWSLKGLHTFIPNYGLVLIIFSIIIKIVVWPLTHKSTKAMSRMSAVQPKMKELQEKHKGHPEKLNKATMQLYKEEGVNPFSSCWPTLLQMPLLYSLFIIFRSTIELRQAPFIFWISDLSAPDIIVNLPFNVPMYGAHIALLPIAMGITQLLMSKVMMTDPKNKAMVYFMPIFMVMIFNNFPSGLSLYYALFNLWTYLQHIYLKRQGVLQSPAKPAKA
ncbi:hypothetical protein CEE37_00200 [candidate division LCP-89 bacterium B3_LCP]|uniref:Membrane protein insertase YidC n=1 Tax=candidate division LCP-89 bacterium B3_LCP TaxID=2012998 RepID=A0A532V4S0_UNCL8|nr:MAG: hypothetical protein CEE37_00200 [candidate division LCP-89 bacterium B3_LCP]